MYEKGTKSVGAPLAVFWIGGYIFSETTNDSFLLLLHLSYYSIAYYIQLLRMKLISTDKNLSDPYWKDIKNVLLQLYRVLVVFQSIFSVPVLFMIATKFTSVSFSSFGIIYVLVKPTSLLSLSWITTHLLNICRNLVSVLIILHAADMPLEQVM